MHGHRETHYWETTKHKLLAVQHPHVMAPKIKTLKVMVGDVSAFNSLIEGGVAAA